jgi:hypothetical protein
MSAGPSIVGYAVHLLSQLDALQDEICMLRSAAEKGDATQTLWQFDKTQASRELVKTTAMRLYTYLCDGEKSEAKETPPPRPKKKGSKRKGGVVIQFRRPEPGPFAGGSTP